MTHIITERCVGHKDKACVDVCPVDCIYFFWEDDDRPQKYIQPEECIDCGLCVDACPWEAIFPIEEVPDNLKSSIATNFSVFDLDPP